MARAGARWAAWLGLMAVAAVGHAQSSVPGSSAPRRSDTEQDVVSLVDSKKQASDDLRENTIWRCLPSSEYAMDPRDVGAPNVSVGIYILNLGQESSAGVGIGSGVFFADFLLYLRQRDRPLNRWMMGTTGSVDPMVRLRARGHTGARAHGHTGTRAHGHTRAQTRMRVGARTHARTSHACALAHSRTHRTNWPFRMRKTSRAFRALAPARGVSPVPHPRTHTHTHIHVSEVLQFLVFVALSSVQACMP